MKLENQHIMDAGEGQHQQRHHDAGGIGDAVKDAQPDGQHQQGTDQDRKPEELVQHLVGLSLILLQKGLVVRYFRPEYGLIALFICIHNDCPFPES